MVDCFWFTFEPICDVPNWLAIIIELGIGISLAGIIYIRQQKIINNQKKVSNSVIRRTLSTSRSRVSYFQNQIKDAFERSDYRMQTYAVNIKNKIITPHQFLVNFYEEQPIIVLDSRSLGDFFINLDPQISADLNFISDISKTIIRTASDIENTLNYNNVMSEDVIVQKINQKLNELNQRYSELIQSIDPLLEWYGDIPNEE